MAERLSDRIVRQATVRGASQRLFWDTEVRGFGLRVTGGGAKAFILDYRIKGRQRRITIGRYPDWSVAAARKEAATLRRAVDRGEDPMGDRHAVRSAPSVRDLWQRYRSDHLVRKAPRSQADETAMWEQLILPRLGRHLVVDIAHADVQALHRAITVERGRPVRANRVIESFRHALNLAVRWGWRPDNPATGIRRNPEHRRQRYLTVEEIQRLMAALDAHGELVSANAIRLLILTGARKAEVLGATWDMFDLDRGLWIKPSAHTKQRREHRVPLSSQAVALLSDMQRTSTGRYLFPGRTPDRPLTDLKRSWHSVCIRAGLAEPVDRTPGMAKRSTASSSDWRPTVRIHDLRHTFASLLVSGGASLPMIGAMLGHTQVQTTQRYAHLYDAPLRAAAEHVGSAISIAAVLREEASDAGT